MSGGSMEIPHSYLQGISTEFNLICDVIIAKVWEQNKQIMEKSQRN